MGEDVFHKFAIAALLCGLPGVALAADEKQERKPDWAVAVDGGTTFGGGLGNQPFVSLSLTRNLDDNYVRVSVSQISADTNARTAIFVPATTRLVRLSGGLALGDFTLEGYGTFGDRAFDARNVRRANNTTINISSSGSIAGGGASLTYDLALSERLFLSPYVAIDYSRITTARVVTGTGLANPLLLNESQSGVTGSGGATLQYVFGPKDRHLLAFTGSALTTSNDASVNRSNATGATGNALGVLNGNGVSDTWGEIALTGSFGLNDRLSFTVNAVRTLGFAIGDTTSISGGLRLAF